MVDREGRADPASGEPDAGELARRVRAGSSPRPGGRRVVLVDGRSGAGKTTLADALADALDAAVVHVEDYFRGWHGLEAGAVEVRDRILVPLAAGRTPRASRWDWHADRALAPEDLPVRPGRTLVVEGCGAGLSAPWFTAPDVLASLLIWIERPLAVRRPRALARDGGRFDPYWDLWAAEEDAFYARHPVAEHADVVVTG